MSLILLIKHIIQLGVALYKFCLTMFTFIKFTKFPTKTIAVKEKMSFG